MRDEGALLLDGELAFTLGFQKRLGSSLEARQRVTSDHVLADEELHVIQAQVTQSGMPRFRGSDTQTMLRCCAPRVLAPLDR
jgi:hypothetical protein